MHLSIGVGSWSVNSVIIKIHLNCIIYQTFNRLSEYLCRRCNYSVLSTCATRAGRSVRTMWLIRLFESLHGYS